MKKVMIGILILIPILILVIVALVSSIVSIQAWISVEDIQLRYKGTENVAENISFNFENVANKTINLYDYIDVKVLPEKANNYTVEWRITGDVVYTDDEYQTKYEKYKQDLSALKAELEAEYPNFSDAERKSAYNTAKSRYGEDSVKIISAMADALLTRVYPAACMVDDSDNETASNSTAKMVIGSYCNFTINVVAENVSKTLNVSVVGDNVERVTIGNLSGEDNNIAVGDSKRLVPNYTPIDSIVNHTIWHSDNEEVATVDQNGVVSAKSAGTANITVQASVHSSEQGAIQYITSSAYTVNVTANGASRKYGQTLYTARTSLTIEELGIDSDATAVEGCTILDGIVTVTSDKAVIATAKGNFEIYSVAPEAIVIENADFFANKTDGYVLAVGEHTLKLRAIHADELSNGNLGVVEWSSSDTDVATVNESGEVKGVANGRVVITAKYGSEQTSIELNVQSKLTSIQLRTSNGALAVGLARETVFASERYSNDAFEKEANFVRIVVQGEPKGATESELAAFYASYDFEIVSGGEYAHFDETVANKLVFDSALEGKGKQNIVVRVSARYPKYEGISKFTTEEVTIKAIYGVAVTNIAQLRNAAKYQNEYAKAEGNYIGHEMTYNINPEGGRYFVYTQHGSHKTYAICLESNVAFEKNEDGTGKYIDYADTISFYGDLYGNNHMLSALKGQLGEKVHATRIAWSNVTVSNIILRVNDLGDDTEINNADDTQGFTGEAMYAGDDDQSRVHLTGLRFEYIIFENGEKALNSFNCDMTIDGCIMRNFTSCGMYVPQRMYWKDEEQGFAIFYSNITFNNFTASNMLGSLMSTCYERYTITELQEYVDGNGKTAKKSFGRFIRDDLDANEQYFMENLYSKGINLVVRQTGFFNIYNWQNVDNAKLIDVGDASLNQTIGTMCGDLIRQNSLFKNYRYEGKGDDAGKCWFHIAFVCTGISAGEGIFTEKTYLDLAAETDDIHSLKTRDIKPEGSGVPLLAANLVKNLSVELFGYANTNPITPYSTYQINAAFIDKLH